MPEMPLLLLSSVGGWLGAQLGQLCFRAQTRERAFRVFLNLSILPVLALAAMMAAQDVDWGSLAAKIPEILAAQTASPAEEVPAATDAAEPVATDAAVAAPAVTKPVVTKPVVRDTAKASAPKETSVTDNPDLPRRFGPSSKKQAWQSR
jgi:hypothetical protein